MIRMRRLTLAVLSFLPFLFLLSVSESASAACPPLPASFDSAIEPVGEEFCLFYDAINEVGETDANSTSADQANRSATHTADYWEAYVDEMGFPAPEYSDVAVKFHVRLSDANAASDNVGQCNGFVSPGDTFLTTFDECDASPTLQPELLQYVFGHELYHQVQLGDGGNDPSSNNFDALWFHEGTARSMEDKVFGNVDNWANALSAPFSYNKEVNNYLANTNIDLTSDPNRYLSALWWTYYSEQCGTTPGPVRQGVDAFGVLWTAALSADNISALNQALSSLGCPDFNSMFRRFTLANWTKDLSGAPGPSYNYSDEDEAGNPAPYGPLIPADAGTIDIGSPATFSNQGVSRYGARYYSATPGAKCPLVSASFHRDSGADPFYHVITEKGTALATNVEGSGADWEQSFLNDGITRIIAIIGGQANSAQIDLTLSCAEPVIDIKLPDDLATAFVGPFDTPGKFLAQVLVTNGSPTGPVVGGLTNSDFKAEVNGIPSSITTGGFIQEQYWLLVQSPVQAADGTYSLEVFLEEPGTSNVIATDTNPASLVYDANDSDHVLIVDRSGSMASSNKMQAAQDAASFYVDITRNSEGLAVVPFQSDVDPAPFAMQSVDLTVKNDAKSFVNGLTPGTATSIGDGLDEAVNQRAGSTTGNPRCSFVLLSDGMENQSLLWVDVQAAVAATGCPVTAIAFGPESNEILMQEIATATGGPSFYNDVFVSLPAGAALSGAPVSPEDMALDLGSTYEFAQAAGEGRQRLLAEKGTIPFPVVEQAHKVIVDNTLSEVLFAVDWPGRVLGGGVEMRLRLETPSGNIIDPQDLPYDFEDFRNGHLGWRIGNPEPGTWLMLVTHQGGSQKEVRYQALASGQTNLTLQLLLPDTLGASFFTGNSVLIPAFLSSDRPVLSSAVVAIVTAPDGTETTVRLLDDGQNNDGLADDGFYAGTYTRINQAERVQPAREEGGDQTPSPLDEGAYRVLVLASSAGFQRESLGSFAVLEGDDGNDNGMPDTFEDEHQVRNPNADPDLDGLDNLSEYLSGTDPNDSDSDGGGENDGSEVLLHRLDPLDPRDDQIEAPDFFHRQAGDGSVLLSYDVKVGYARLELYRATTPDGPWVLGQAELPLGGAYADPADNDATYFYRLIAVDSADHHSAVLDSGQVTPREDPIPPEARVIINGGTPSTPDLNVDISFASYGEFRGNESFDDITDVLLSNDPFFQDAIWQPFAQDLPWELAPGESGDIAKVYARFRDDQGNESAGTEVGSILFQIDGPLPSQADPSFTLHQDSSDDATGFKVDLTRVFDPITGNNVNVDLESFQAGLTYLDASANPAFPPGTLCVNILDVREMDFPIIGRSIDNTSGLTTFNGSDAIGLPWPTDLGHLTTRLTGSATQQCQVDLDVTSLSDIDGNPIAVPPVLSQTVQRGDARADGEVNIADAMFIAQYLAGSREACTAEVTTSCLHSVNAASVQQDGAFDRITLEDAQFIAQYLLGLRDDFYSEIQASPNSVTFDLNQENDSGQSGRATLTSRNGQTEVVLNLTPGALESELVHIHSGQCGDSLGGVVHSLTSFADGAGVSVTIVNAPLSSFLTGDFAVNTHKKGESSVYTACGNIPAAP